MHRKSITLTTDQVRHLFNYEPTTGRLTWRNPTARAVSKGDIAGTVAKNGNRYVSIGDERYMAHRIVWLMVYGEWPKENVSARNGNFDDLRLENLQLKSFTQTARNRKGAKGVSYEKHTGKWRAEITRNWQRIQLGRFETEQEALAAYKEAASLDVPELPEDVKKARLVSNRQDQLVRNLWARTLRDNDGVTGWASVTEFISDIKDVAFPYCRVISKNDAMPVGPDNFQVERMAKHDRRTPDGRVAYYKYRNRVGKERHKRHALMRSFGMSLEQYNDMLTAQGHVCRICGSKEIHSRAGTPRSLSVDHCHTTGEVRGILCHNCNHGLGNFRDNPEFLRAAAQYIEHHAAKSNSVPASEHPPENIGARAS